jgi:hypothetical protein
LANGTPKILFLAFSAADAIFAHAEWGANCGPAALAACLGVSLDTIRPHLGDFERRGYMNVSMMRDAIERPGFRLIDSPRDAESFPAHGLVRIQWGGPWIGDGVSQRWAARATHWIATKTLDDQPWVFDINGGWMLRREWEDKVVPLIVGSIKRADGTWEPSHRWEVRRG